MTGDGVSPRWLLMKGLQGLAGSNRSLHKIAAKAIHFSQLSAFLLRLR